MAKRHFPYQHPTFGTAKNPKTSSHWKVSVYYWWFEYIKRNSDYQTTCKNNGKGKCSKLFEDFGDVLSLSFKEWWSDGERGATLFADPPTPTIRVIDLQGGEYCHLQQGNMLLLQVPLNLPINYLVRNFRDVISKRHSGRRGKRHSQTSTAKFQATGKIDVAFLEIALMVWDAKSANPKKPLWQIAQEVGIAGSHKIAAGDSPAVITDKKNVLAATASRYYRKANKMIQRTGEGRFPY